MPTVAHLSRNTFWFLTICLAVGIGVVLIDRGTNAQVVTAMPKAIAEESQLIAMPLFSEQGQSCFVLIDKQKSTMCVYSYNVYKPQNVRLQLVAARNYSQDLDLNEFNCAEPTPTDIRNILKQSSAAEAVQEEVTKQ